MRPLVVFFLAHAFNITAGTLYPKTFGAVLEGFAVLAAFALARTKRSETPMPTYDVTTGNSCHPALPVLFHKRWAPLRC